MNKQSRGDKKGIIDKDSSSNSQKNSLIKDIITFFSKSILTPIVITLLTFYFIQKPHDENINLTVQKYSHQSAVVQKQMEYAEKIIADRQNSLVILNRLISVVSTEEKNQFISELKIQMKNAQINNSLSLIYLYQPIYDAMLNFDSLLKETFLKLSSAEISKDELEKNRKELGKRIDEIIHIARGNVLFDSTYFSIRNKLLELE